MLDNGQPKTNASGSSWTLVTNEPSAQDGDYHRSDDGSAQASYSWVFTLPQAGTYDIQVRWPAVSGLVKDVPVSLISTGVTTKTVLIDQSNRTNGGQWMSLGAYTTKTTSLTIRLSEPCKTTSTYDRFRGFIATMTCQPVGADAVRVVPQ